MKTLLEWIDGLIPGTWSEPFFHWHQKRIILEDKVITLCSFVFYSTWSN